jgi:transitional endoplasmic reticulum ATPase
MDAEKESLIEWIYLPLAAPQQAQRYGLSLSPTLLVEGPPGTGKSFLLRRFAQGSGFTYKIIHTPALAVKWYGETERRLRNIVHSAVRKAPALLVFEELESLFPDREQNLPWLTGPVQQFLLLLDEIKNKQGIAVIGITNHAQRLDKALVRPGRFDHKLYVPPPDFTERLLFLSRHAQTLPFAPGIDWTHWAETTSGYTRADLAHLLQEAGRRAFLRHWREGAPQLITEEDLRLALKSV